MYDFKKVEEESRKIWKKHQEDIDKAIHLEEKKPLFSFLEGPPTANAPPGLHHLEVRTFKDIICKFKFMRGFSVPRKGGWDCHGLPVEVQIEKKLGLADKKAVIDYGVKKFVEEARSSVFSNISDWEKSTQELGYWIDLEKPYVTMDNNYIESVWWSLKELYNKQMLYEGHKVVPYCPRCGTPLSSHEVAQGYKDLSEVSVYVKFELEDEPNTFLLAWTTTPWTLPGNSALYVHKDFEYVKVKPKDKEEFYILAKERTEILDEEFEIVENIKPSDLVGKKYKPLFDYFKGFDEKYYHIDYADFVELEQGTGLVHSAIMYGEVDFERAKEQGLKPNHTIGEDGKVLESVEIAKGLFYKDADPVIIKDLAQRNLLYKKERITHAYPHCWRCDTPLLYYAIKSWFIKVSSINKKLIKLNQQINWEPSHIKDGRFGKWLENAKDWALSRSKFWGTPLPVWRCECGEEKVIGSKKELIENSSKKISEKIDLHKPIMDDVKLKCSCGKEMKRVTDVIDCWYDSGSASFAQFHYPFENKEEFEKRFPYDFISEAIDQTRGWFYTLHVLAAILFDKPAYKNVICAGHIVDEKGLKMSKSRGNIIKPREIIDQAGVDSIRLQFCTTDIGNFKPFSFNLMKDAVLPFLTVLYNSNNYYLQAKNKKNKPQVEDKWILSKLNSLIEGVTKDLDNYFLNNAFTKILNFVVKDLSRGYIKLTRDREDTKEVLGEILEKVSLLLAPFAPYLSEYIYKEFSKTSVHLSSWPKANSKRINSELELEMDEMFRVIEAGLRQRDKCQIGLKWPLAKATIFSEETLKKELQEIVKSQLNVKSLKFENSKELAVELDLELTPELEAEGFAREISRNVQAFRKELGLNKEDKIELALFVDEEFKKILEPQKKFLSSRTNAEVLAVEDSNVTTDKERFKNKTIFKIKKKSGEIGIIKLQNK